MEKKATSYDIVVGCSNHTNNIRGVESVSGGKAAGHDGGLRAAVLYEHCCPTNNNSNSSCEQS